MKPLSGGIRAFENPGFRFAASGLRRCARTRTDEECGAPARMRHNGSPFAGL